jgi:signal transduction histidine kinase
MPAGAQDVMDLSATTAAAVEYLAPWAISQGVTLGFDAPGRSVMVHGDADAITDALRNLVENAVAHGPEGTEVAVAVLPDGRVTVSDDGPGVPSADRARVFERFWRGAGARRAGAGLGLAIVAEIARAHSGTVTVEDAPGGGARFVIALRLA